VEKTDKSKKIVTSLDLSRCQEGREKLVSATLLQVEHYVCYFQTPIPLQQHPT
jgi:hypothetical protein